MPKSPSLKDSLTTQQRMPRGFTIARTGPFTTVTTTAALSTQFGRQFNDSNCGDFALFADDDGAGYLMYSSDHHVQVRVGIMSSVTCSCLLPVAR